jgi:uncharacterized protein YbjT (DUF2867 family)
VDVIVHCASGRGDVTAGRNLIRAAQAVGSPHLVLISIAGIDRVPLRHYRAKLATERLTQASGLPWTILRATQFHDLILRLFTAQARLPVLAVALLALTARQCRARRGSTPGHPGSRGRPG